MKGNIPNTIIDRMFMTGNMDIQDIRTYLNLVEEGSSQSIASATAFASRKIEAKWLRFIENEHLLPANDQAAA